MYFSQLVSIVVNLNMVNAASILRNRKYKCPMILGPFDDVKVDTLRFLDQVSFQGSW